MELCWIPGHAYKPGNEFADKKPKEASRRQKEIIARPYQGLFPYNNDAFHEKWNTGWNEKDDNFMQIKTDTRPGKETYRCKNDETVINRLRAGHTLLNRG